MQRIVRNFMKNPYTVMRPICIGDQVVEQVKTYKLLEVVISEDLKWNLTHVEHVIQCQVF